MEGWKKKIKNFTLLLNAFKLSKVHEKGMKLLIVGDGSDKGFIEAKITALELQDFVEILPFKNNITPYIQYAHSSILTSHFEGFPMSLVEALGTGTPVIAVDCETGPREIIQNGVNGLLVKNYDENALAKAISDMVSDEKLYQTCKINAQKSIEHLSLTNIAAQWKQILPQK